MRRLEPWTPVFNLVREWPKFFNQERSGIAFSVGGSWGSYSINDVSAILPNYFDGGADDYARDPDVQKWLLQGGSSINPEVRKEAYSAAIKKITEQAYWAPLHTYVTTYGHSKQLDFTP